MNKKICSTLLIFILNLTFFLAISNFNLSNGIYLDEFKNQKITNENTGGNKEIP